MRHSRATHALRTTVVAATLLGLAACGSGGGDTAADDGAAPTTSTAPTAPEALEAALLAITDAGTAAFTSHVELGATTYDDAGVFSLDAGAQQFTRRADLGEGRAYEIEARSVDGAFYVQQPGSDDAPSSCWLVGDPERLAAATGAGLGEDSGSLPAAAYAASSGTGTKFKKSDPDAVVGTVDLARAAAVVTGQLPDQLGLEIGQERVKAVFTLADGELTGFAVKGKALDRAVRDAGPATGRTFPRGTRIEVGFSDVGAEVDVAAPDPETVIDLLDPDAADPGTCSAG